MSGVAFTTISPSSTSSRRSTPCVEGCCGPIEIVICVSSGRSTTSNCGGSVAELIYPFGLWPLVLGLCCSKTKVQRPKTSSFQAIRLITSQRKIFPERVSLPVIRQEDASQIRMPVENHTKQIKRLTFVPIRRSPHTSDARNMSVLLVQQHLQANAMVFSG